MQKSEFSTHLDFPGKNRNFRLTWIFHAKNRIFNSPGFSRQKIGIFNSPGFSMQKSKFSTHLDFPGKIRIFNLPGFSRQKSEFSTHLVFPCINPNFQLTWIFQAKIMNFQSRNLDFSSIRLYTQRPSIENTI